MCPQAPNKDSEMVYLLQANSLAGRTDVGGKALSLIKLLKAGLEVPDGFILSTRFFSSWFDQLFASDEWQSFLKAQDDNLDVICAQLKNVASNFTFNREQHENLQQHAYFLSASKQFAVRSSSPDEDGETMSFAGAYASYLGVTPEGLERAIKQVFCSCLDARIVSYKRQQGIATDTPSIAVIVQEQVAAEKAGVGFSLNPLNNDYDEVVINANWGLGSTVVDGLVDSDYFIVRADLHKVIEKKLGCKESSASIDPQEGYVEKVHPLNNEFCLTEAELITLSDTIKHIEAYFHKPVDVEWAFKQDELFILQARPITTYFQLPENIVDKPGSARRLYFDVTLSVQGLMEPVSPMGTSIYERIVPQFKNEVMGNKRVSSIERSIYSFGNGKVYLHVINMAKFMGGKERVAAFVGQADGLVKQSIDSLNFDDFYQSKLRTPLMRIAILSKFYRRIIQLIRGLKKPKFARERWNQKWTEFELKVNKIDQTSATPLQYSDEVFKQACQFICRETLNLFFGSKIALAKIHKLFPNPNVETLVLLKKLDKSLPGNVTVEMGHDLYKLHEFLSKDQARDVKTLHRHIDEKSISAEFLDHWTAFLVKYGHRCEREIDAAAPRYREDPTPLLQQLVDYVQQDAYLRSPLENFHTSQQERNDAFLSLSSQLEGKALRRFEKLYRVVEWLGGLREGHKFVMVYAFDRIRQYLLARAKLLRNEGRINHEEDIFFLTLEQLEQGLANSQLDLHKLVTQGRKNHTKHGQCKNVFSLIDSRGRFHRPPPTPIKAGEIQARPLSSGRAVGPVKVLSHPEEKPVYPGEILVARSTNPAWTLLFVNAAGIVLEIGGPIQHGALVAREYGKPCVSDVVNATSIFQDGDIVQIDGDTGIISRIDANERLEDSATSAEKVAETEPA